MSDADALRNGVEPLPVLHHDGSRLDWLTAKYSSTVALKHQASAVIHTLSDAPEIEQLLYAGDAVFATEIRCPRTMLSRVEQAAGQEQRIDWHDDERNDDLYLIPGIIAVSDTTLSASGLHPLVRGDRTQVEIPAGWWLARGGEYRFTPLFVSLLKFVKDNEERLKLGTMSVEEAGISGNPQFRITLAADLYDHRRESRDVQVAALIAAFGLLPRSSMRNGENNDDCPLADALRSKFEDADPPIDNWDSEFFDPALAATTLENFWIDPGEDQ